MKSLIQMSVQTLNSVLCRSPFCKNYSFESYWASLDLVPLIPFFLSDPLKLHQTGWKASVNCHLQAISTDVLWGWGCPPMSEVTCTLEQLFLKENKESFPQFWPVSLSLPLWSTPIAWCCHHHNYGGQYDPGNTQSLRNSFIPLPRFVPRTILLQRSTEFLDLHGFDFCPDMQCVLWDLIYTGMCLSKLCPINSICHRWTPMKLLTDLKEFRFFYTFSKMSKNICNFMGYWVKIYGQKWQFFIKCEIKSTTSVEKVKGSKYFLNALAGHTNLEVEV